MHPLFVLLLLGVVWTLVQTTKFYRRADMQRAMFWLVALLILVLVARSFA